MIVKLLDWNGFLSLQFTQEDNDLVLNNNVIHMATNVANFKVEFDVEETHPDLIALSSILLAYPFFTQEIKVPFAVSKEFSDTFYSVTKRKVSPVDPFLKPRISPEKSVPSLCFSGGIDSTAALMLMPKETKMFFCDRMIPSNTKSLYNKYAALNTVNDLFEAGYDITTVPTDFEYIRSRVGFPTDLASAVPSLLLADKYSIDSIAFGLIMESGYRVGHNKYENYLHRTHYKRWGTLFKLVGCPLYLPVVGLSEVGTSKIAQTFSHSHTVRSCMRGDEYTECGKCIKCLRKSLLASALNNVKVDDSLIKSNLQSAEVIKTLSGEYIRHENVYRYILNKIDLPVLSRLNSYIKDESEDVSWMEKWYKPSLEFVPDKYKFHHVSMIHSLVSPTTYDDESYIERWERQSALKNDNLKFEWLNDLESLIESEKLKKVLPKFNL
ncbi:DUF6395 domain-containing protein [Shewanella gaetbuli]|uniref:DUF6395 domain-containing protein n=1 Tax=Shewanella gaetbuli TaxID=220752 RepID=A0A9X1ZHC4_9GAMM|nr:DUF6395 domain-containing protein [Shewanella gaetbuli]MCL1142329.1 DUF6395 domain-containing protein [Shewanella gaetbuli]